MCPPPPTAVTPSSHVSSRTLFLNAARVPRIIYEQRGVFRHHIALRLGADGASADEILVRGRETPPG